MEKQKFLLLDVTQPVHEQMDEACFEVAKTDLWEYFMSIFTKSRQIAASQQNESEELKISNSMWTEAKFKTRSSWGNKKKAIVIIMEFILILGGLITGYGFSNLKEDYVITIIGILTISFSYIIKILKENK